MYYSTYNSPVGLLTIVADEESIIGLWMGPIKTNCSTKVIEKDDISVFHLTKKWLDQYFSGQKPDIKKLPLKLAGTNFRQKVWKMLMEIPYGEVTTYGFLAKKISKKMSSQAVGGAIGHNPISIIIPCHRVIGSSGNLTGFSGGIDKKIQLLKHEGIDTSKMFIL